CVETPLYHCPTFLDVVPDAVKRNPVGVNSGARIDLNLAVSLHERPDGRVPHRAVTGNCRTHWSVRAVVLAGQRGDGVHVRGVATAVEPVSVDSSYGAAKDALSTLLQQLRG